MYKKKITELSQVCDSTVEYTYDDYYDWLIHRKGRTYFW